MIFDHISLIETIHRAATGSAGRMENAFVSARAAP
jgi:hypothetical protein